MMKVFQISFVVVVALSSQVLATVTFEKMDINIVDPSKATFNLTVHPKTSDEPRMIDIDVHSFLEAKDISLKIGAYSLIDGKYNEVFETETFSWCDMSKSENLLIKFVHKEMEKYGNLTSSPCPIQPGYHHLRKFTIRKADIPNDIQLPPGNFKIELNGTLHGTDGIDHPVFITDIFFKDVE